MNNSSYWIKRKAQRMFEYMTSAEQKADDIAKLYLSASQYLTKEASKVFNRYKNKFSLSETEARALINQLHDKKSIDELKLLLAQSTDSVIKKELLAELEAPAYRARLERLQELNNKISAAMIQIYKQEQKHNTEFYLDTLHDAYYKSIFDIQQGIGFGFSFAEVDTDLIDKIINSKWIGANYSSRIWTNTQAVAARLRETVLMDLLTGRTEFEAAQEFDKEFAVGAAKARRLIRTETCFVAEQAEIASYEECGIEHYRFLATLDLRTSIICQELDGKRFKTSEQQPGINCPPMHPWCRSTTTADISDEELKEMKRRARNPETGENELVPADMNYKEWYDKYVNPVDWKEVKVTKKNVNNQFTVDRKIVNSKRYTDKFNGSGNNKKIDRIIRNESIEILDHRDGTKAEDVVYLDTRTGKRLFINNTSTEELGIRLTQKENDIITQHKGNIITIHNHPYGTRPSIGDIITMQNTISISKIVVAGHNGKVYTISNLNRNNDIKAVYERELQYYKTMYGGDVYIAQEKAAQAIYNMKLFDFKEE